MGGPDGAPLVGCYDAEQSPFDEEDNGLPSEPESCGDRGCVEWTAGLACASEAEWTADTMPAHMPVRAATTQSDSVFHSQNLRGIVGYELWLEDEAAIRDALWAPSTAMPRTDFGSDLGSAVHRTDLGSDSGSVDSSAPHTILSVADLSGDGAIAGAIRMEIQSAGCGIPAAAVTRLAPADFQEDISLIAEFLPNTPLRAWHPSRRFAETAEFMATVPDVMSMQSPQTMHVPVLWFHTAQVARAAACSVEIPIAEGPSPYGGLPAEPETMAAQYVSPQVWAAKVGWYEAMSAEIKRVQRGYKFRYSRVPGGKQGLRVDESWTRSDRRRVPMENVNGFAVPRFPKLPDEFTDIDVGGMYALAAKEGVSDMATASGMGLYGIRSGCAASAATHLAPNYSPAWESIDHLQAERLKKRTEFVTPRLLAPRLEPSGNPDRANPKSAIRQIKADGSIKDRGLTDPGFPRQRRVQLSDLTWVTTDSSDAAGSTPPGSTGQRRFDPGARLHVLQAAKKGPPGLDSINANMHLDQAEGAAVVFNYGSTRLFGEQVVVLCTSGVAVDLWFEDFDAHYEQFPQDFVEQWYCTQMVAEMAETDPRACFGYSHLPTVLNRHNFMMEEIISIRQRRAQDQINWTPWSTQMRQQTEAFQRRRRGLSQSGDLFCKNAWFDDNQGAALRPFVEAARGIQRNFWLEFKVAFSKRKSAFNPWETQLWEAAVGVEIRARLRQCVLPANKVVRYTEGVEEIERHAATHPQHLIPRDLVETAIGRAVHACDPIPDMWIVLIALLALFTDQSSFKHWIRGGSEMMELFARMKSVLREQNGRPLASYHPRPGADGLPVLITFSDASRRVGTYFGAAGGWFYLRETNVIFFFCWLWPPAMVEQCNIGELETKAAEITARLADDVVTGLLRHFSKYYMYQFGDNEGAFGHALNSFHSRKKGMRWLTHQRAILERQCQRLLETVHCLRTQNKLADALANMDVAVFLERIQKLHPGARVQQLMVPHDYADLRQLIVFKTANSS